MRFQHDPDTRRRRSQRRASERRDRRPSHLERLEDRTLLSNGATRYVTALYQDLLEREPDGLGLPAFVGRLEEGASRSEVVDVFQRSTERGELLIEDYYQTFLDREPDALGRAAWQETLSGAPREAVMAGILASDEYLAAAGDSIDGFLDSLYEDVLGRKIDPVGQTDWGARLGGAFGPTARRVVAQGIISSPEARISTLEGFYAGLLGRAPDGFGMPLFLDAFAGGTNEAAIESVFLASGEYFEKVTAPEVDPPPADDAPSEIEAGLANDTGEDGDGLTSNPTIAGTITSAQPIAGLTARFLSQSEDAAVDITDAVDEDGTFVLSRARLEAILGEPLIDGTYTLRLLTLEGEVLGEGDAVELIGGTDVSFTLDTAAPTPSIDLSGTLNVAPEVILIDFDEPVVTPDASRLRLLDSAGEPVPIAEITSPDPTMPLVDFGAPLDDGDYEFIIDPVNDLAGNAPDGEARFSFTVAQPVSVAALSPSNGEEMVNVTRETIVRFDDQVDPSTVTDDSFFLIARGAPVPGTIRVSSTERFATFFYDDPLPASTEVRVVLDGDRILGRDGLPIDADGDGLPGGRRTADFSTLPLTRVPGTNVFGTVRDSLTGEPIEGATIRVDAFPQANVVTDENGFFELEDMPAPEFFVHVDGSTATNAPDGFVYPNVGKPFHSVPGQRVPLEMNGEPFDVFLPPMAEGDVQALSSSEATDVGFGDAGLSQLQTLLPDVDPEAFRRTQVTFAPGSAIDEAGNPATEAAVIPVPSERIPAPLPPNLDPELVISIQASGATNFDVPAPIEFPNLEGLAPGEKSLLFSFNHDAGRFEVIGTGTVSEDGLTVVSDPGVGVPAPGWHFTQPGSDDDRKTCVGEKCEEEDEDVDFSVRNVDASNPSNVIVTYDVSPNDAVLEQVSFFVNGQELGNRFGVSGQFSFSFDQTGLPMGSSSIGVLAVPEEGASSIFKEFQATRTSGRQEAREITFIRVLEQAPLITANHNLTTDFEVVSYDAPTTADSKLLRITGHIAILSYPNVALAPQISVHNESLRYVVGGNTLAGPQLTDLDCSSGCVSDPTRVTSTKVADEDRWFNATQGVTVIAAIDSVLFGTPGGLVGGVVVNPEVDLVLSTMGAQGFGGASLRSSADESVEPPTSFSTAPGFGNDPRSFYRYVTESGIEIAGRTNRNGDFSAILPPETNFTLFVYNPAQNRSRVLIGRSGPSGSTVRSSDAVARIGGPDRDGDGIPDIGERAIGTSRTDPDSDGDGIPDAAELEQGLNPLDGRAFPTGVISSLDLPGNANEVEVEEDLVYVATGDHGLAIVDGSEFDLPILLGQLDLPGNATDVGIDPASSLAAVATGSTLQIVDVSDPMMPEVARGVGVGATRVEVVDGVSYVTSGTSLRAIDMATGSILASRTLPGGGEVTGLAREGRMLYAFASGGRTLSVIDIATLDDPQVVGQFANVNISNIVSVFAANEIVYLGGAGFATPNGLATVDVSDPSNPTLISDPDFFFDARGLALNGSGLALVGSEVSGRGVSAYNVQDPEVTDNLVLPAVPMPGRALDIAISRGIAYIAGGTGGLHVLNYLPFDNNGNAPTVEINPLVQDIDPNADRIQVLEGTDVPIRAAVTDDVQVRNVDLLVNGEVVRSDVSFPFDFSAVAPNIEGGSDSFTVQVRATDTGGNSALSDVLTIELVPDTFPPTIEEISPNDGGVLFEGNRTLRIRFNEPIAPEGVSPDNIRLIEAGPDGTFGTDDDVNMPADIQLRDGDRQIRIAVEGLTIGTYQLQVERDAITDRAGNALGQGVLNTGFTVEERTSRLTGNDIVFVIDVSGSTGFGFDGTPVGDVNDDGLSDTILDAELAGIIALNQELINLGLGETANVSIVTFSGAATILDMDPDEPDTQVSTTPVADADGDGIRDVEGVLSSIRDGGSTDFDDALQAALDAFDAMGTEDGQGNLIFLSDGESSSDISDELVELAARDINRIAFGTGAGADLSRLREIDPEATRFESTDELLDAFFDIGDGA